MKIGQILSPLSYPVDDTFLKFLVTEDQLPDWCISLSALEKNIISQIKLFDKHGRGIGSISLIGENKNFYTQGKYREIELSINALEYWLAFLLRYLRDGVAEVDHIDVNAGFVGETDQSRSLILSVDHSTVPMSSEEMNKILEL